MAAAGPRWAIQQLLCVMPRVDTGPLSGKRAVWTARGMLQRPPRALREGSRALQARRPFRERGGRGEARA